MWLPAGSRGFELATISQAFCIRLHEFPFRSTKLTGLTANNLAPTFHWKGKWMRKWWKINRKIMLHHWTIVISIARMLITAVLSHFALCHQLPLQRRGLRGPSPQIQLSLHQSVRGQMSPKHFPYQLLDIASKNSLKRNNRSAGMRKLCSRHHNLSVFSAFYKNPNPVLNA